MNTSMAQTLERYGFQMCIVEKPHLLEGYDGHVQATASYYEVSMLFKFPKVTRVEHNVQVFVYHSSNPEPEIIISNKFLHERWLFDLLEQLQKH